MNIKYEIFGIFFISGLILLIFKFMANDKKPFYILGALFSFIFISQLWPIKNLGALTYPSYYGIFPQFLLCLILIELHKNLFIDKKKIKFLILYSIITALNFMNLKTWNPYNEVFNNWKNGHISKEQKNLYNLSKTKKLLNNFKFEENKYSLISIPKFNSIPYSHKYGDPKYDWHKNKLELDAILPFYYGKKIIKNEIRTIQSEYDNIQLAQKLKIRNFLK